MRIRTAAAIAALSAAAACGRKDVNAGARVPRTFAANEANARRARGLQLQGAGEAMGAGMIATGARGGGLRGGLQTIYAEPPARFRPAFPGGEVAARAVPHDRAGPLGGGTTGTGPGAGPIGGGTNGHGAAGGGLSGAGSQEGRPTVSDEAEIGYAEATGGPPPPPGPGGLAPATQASGEEGPARFVFGKVASLRGDALELRAGNGTVSLRLAPGARIAARGWPIGRAGVAPGQDVRASLDPRGGDVVALEVAGPTPLGR